MAKRPVSDAAETFGAGCAPAETSSARAGNALPTTAVWHRTFIGQIERRQRNVSLHNILRPAEALGVNAAELVRGGFSGAEDSRD